MTRSAFSLVELSIVLVILGLLTGGILTGQNLIRAAEIRSVTTETTEFNIAVMSFKDRYFQYPGDMSNATDFWGCAGGNCAHTTCPNNVTAESPLTCNGTGDGRIHAHVVPGSVYEASFFWKHLSNSGLIPGQYSGRTVGSVISRPISKLSDKDWSISNSSGNTRLAPAMPFAAYTIGTASSADFVITAEEMWGIDKKIDDGKPGRGIVQVYNFHNSVVDNYCTTATAFDDLDADYNFVKGLNCKPYIKAGP